MPDFRRRPHPTPGNVWHRSLEDIRGIIAEVLDPNHFFVGKQTTAAWEHVPMEQVPWEIFRGHLLDPAQTRERRLFTVWNVLLRQDSAPPEAALSVKHDAESARLYVTRALPCHAWEGYHAGDNVYLSRERIKWVQELVGSVDLSQGAGAEELRDEIAGLLLAGVVGMSRLPLTSVESPLPVFTLGELGYFFHPDRQKSEQGPIGPMRSWRELIEHGLHAEQAWLLKARLLELLLRAVPAAELGESASKFAARWQSLGHAAHELAALLRTLFNEVALSPYTGFVDQALAFVQHLVENGSLLITEQVDFLGTLLRRLGRHLTAYDLVTFHHAGANYPDALLLDAVLKVTLNLAQRRPELFLTGVADPEAAARPKRLRRRAVRQGWLLRRGYEGHPVPDAPTSPGENARVLPPPHVRVPDEQLTQPARRTRRLYAGDPLPGHLGAHARSVLRESLRDLEHPAELQELGMAVFIERPLGVFKEVGEPDQTLLLAHEGFSKSIVEKRLLLLQRDTETGITPEEGDVLRLQLRALPVQGLSLDVIATAQRPVVSLADARRAAADFVFTRTLPRGLTEFLEHFDPTPLAIHGGANLLSAPQQWLLVRVISESSGPPGTLAVFDGALQKRLELEVNREQGYATWAGREVPAGGLRVLRVWDATGQELDLAGADMTLAAR